MYEPAKVEANQALDDRHADQLVGLLRAAGLAPDVVAAFDAYRNRAAMLDAQAGHVDDLVPTDDTATVIGALATGDLAPADAVRTIAARPVREHVVDEARDALTRAAATARGLALAALRDAATALLAACDEQCQRITTDATTALDTLGDLDREHAAARADQPTRDAWATALDLADRLAATRRVAHALRGIRGLLPGQPLWIGADDYDGWRYERPWLLTSATNAWPGNSTAPSRNEQHVASLRRAVTAGPRELNAEQWHARRANLDAGWRAEQQRLEDERAGITAEQRAAWTRTETARRDRQERRDAEAEQHRELQRAARR